MNYKNRHLDICIRTNNYWHLVCVQTRLARNEINSQLTPVNRDNRTVWTAVLCSWWTSETAWWLSRSHRRRSGYRFQSVKRNNNKLSKIRTNIVLRLTFIADVCSKSRISWTHRKYSTAHNNHYSSLAGLELCGTKGTPRPVGKHPLPSMLPRFLHVKTSTVFPFRYHLP